MPTKIIDRLPRNLYKLRKILNFYEMVNHYLTPQTIGILSFPVYGILTSIKIINPILLSRRDGVLGTEAFCFLLLGKKPVSICHGRNNQLFEFRYGYFSIFDNIPHPPAQVNETFFKLIENVNFGLVNKNRWFQIRGRCFLMKSKHVWKFLNRQRTLVLL
jgi:hypothetical protein